MNSSRCFLDYIVKLNQSWLYETLFQKIKQHYRGRGFNPQRVQSGLQPSVTLVLESDALLLPLLGPHTHMENRYT